MPEVEEMLKPFLLGLLNGSVRTNPVAQSDTLLFRGLAIRRVGKIREAGFGSTIRRTTFGDTAD